MKKIIAISVASLAALTFSSCTCTACGGSGLQIRTSSGWVPTPAGTQAGRGHETRECAPCGGTGIKGFKAMKSGVETGQSVYQQVDDNTRRR